MNAIRFPFVASALVGAVGAAHAGEMATVVSSTAVTAPVSVSQQVCTDDRQVVPGQPSGVGALVGAVAGGVIGNAFGGGAGRALATGVGAVAGSIVGNQVENDAAARTGYEVGGTRCHVVRTSEERVVGYDVMYEYRGQRYSTRMATDPGRQVAVNLSSQNGVSVPVPVEAAPSYAAAGQPVPQAGAQAVAPAPTYAAPAPVYAAPAPAYLPAPVYYYPAPVYVNPVPSISFGIGYYGGYHRRWR